MKEKADVFKMTKSFQMGEEKGFAYFFNTLYPALLYYAFRFMNDKFLAEDVVQRSFIKIWERHHSFDHPQVIKSWLYTTTRNACLVRIREINSRGEHHKIIASESEDSYAPTYEDNIIRAEVVNQMRKAINILPTECKKVFKCLYILDCSVRQTADRLGLSISTVKNQLSRGLQILRVVVDQDGCVNERLKKPNANRKYDYELIDEMRKNMSIPAIAAKIGVTTEKISYILGQIKRSASKI